MFFSKIEYPVIRICIKHYFCVSPLGIFTYFACMGGRSRLLSAMAGEGNPVDDKVLNAYFKVNEIPVHKQDEVKRDSQEACALAVGEEQQELQLSDRAGRVDNAPGGRRSEDEAVHSDSRTRALWKEAFESGLNSFEAWQKALEAGRAFRPPVSFFAPQLKLQGQRADSTPLHDNCDCSIRTRAKAK